MAVILWRCPESNITISYVLFLSIVVLTTFKLWRGQRKSIANFGRGPTNVGKPSAVGQPTRLGREPIAYRCCCITKVSAASDGESCRLWERLSVCTASEHCGPRVHRESKKQDTKLLAITSPTIIRFSNFFTGGLGNKFSTNSYLNIPPRFKYVATLPCEIWMSEKIASFWNTYCN